MSLVIYYVFLLVIKSSQCWTLGFPVLSIALKLIPALTVKSFFHPAEGTCQPVQTCCSLSVGTRMVVCVTEK